MPHRGNVLLILLGEIQETRDLREEPHVSGGPHPASRCCLTQGRGRTRAPQTLRSSSDQGGGRAFAGLIWGEDVL